MGPCTQFLPHPPLVRQHLLPHLYASIFSPTCTPASSPPLVRQHLLPHLYKWGRRCWRTSGGEDAGVQVGEKMLAYKWGRRCWRTSGGEDAGVVFVILVLVGATMRFVVSGVQAW